MGIPIPRKMVFILRWGPGPIYKMHDAFSILPNQLLSRELFQQVFDDIQRHLTAQTFGSISGQVGCTDWQLQRHIDQGDLQAHLHVVDEFWVKRGGWRPWRGQLSCHFGNGRGIGGRDGGWRGAGSSLWRETSSMEWLIRTVSGYRNWPRYSLRWCGWYCNSEMGTNSGTRRKRPRDGRHNLCCSELQYQPLQRRPYKWSISILPRSQFTKSKGNLRLQRLVPLFVPIGVCVTTHDDGTASDFTIGMWRHNQQVMNHERNGKPWFSLPK